MREAHVASAFRVAEKLYEALADDVQRLGMTRRDFLRVATSAAAGMLLTACPPSVLAAIPSDPLSTRITPSSPRCTVTLPPAPKITHTFCRI